MMQTGVIYGRYSSDRQHETSIEDQIRDCRAYAEQNDIQIVGEYIDRACTGRNDDREAFQRMLSDSDSGRFDVVIVWKLDRFARNRYDSAINKARLKRNGIRVLSAMERISDSPEGVLLESLLEGIAEYYSLDLRDKTYRGMVGRALKCKHTGGKPALGYRVTKDKDYEIDESAASTVRLIFEMYADGKSYREILSVLNQRGAKTTSGKPFGQNSLHDLLVNEKYVGVYTFSRTHRGENGRNNHKSDPDAIRIDGGVPAIVSREIWDAVQARMRENKRAPARNKAKVEYLLSGKIFCGECGGAMVGMSAHGNYTYYECNYKKRTHQCQKKPVRREEIEQMVIVKTLALLTNENIAEIASRVAALSRQELAENAELQSVEKSIEETDKRIQNISEAIAQGIITRTTKKMLEDAENERTVLLARRAELHAIGSEPVTEDQVSFWLEHFRTLNIDDHDSRRSIIDALVNSVTVYDDGTLLILYNAKGKSDTVKPPDLTGDGLPAPDNPKIIIVNPTIFGAVIKAPY